MRSFFRYPGGKAKLYAPIAAALRRVAPVATRYVEPFFGGGSIGIRFLTEAPGIVSAELNDRNDALIALWRSVQKFPNALNRCITDFVPTPDAFYEIREILLDVERRQSIPLVRRGFFELVIHQISYSGLGVKSGSPLGGRAQASKYKIDCRWSPDYLCRRIHELHQLFNSLRVVFTSQHFSACLPTSPDSVTYLDPPYYHRGNDLYQFGFTQMDHEELAALLRRGPNWVLSYDDCEEIRDLYSWAKIEELETNYSITTARRRREILITWR
jgi:DNA adenine methylase